MEKGWLCLSKPTDAQGRLGEGYDDVPGESYVWKAELPNGQNVASGDVIAIWDGERLLGVSRIEGEIEEFEGLRVEFSCPDCEQADVRPRKKEKPRYRCAKCHWTGDVPNQRTVKRLYRRATFAAGWCEIQRHVSAEECRALSVNPKSQLSLRDIDLEKLEAILLMENARVVEPFRRRNPQLNGGHVLRTVRTRKGQGAFRDKMLERFADTCAITGTNHPGALEAAHLYRYAEIGVHHEDGGLLLRRDIHTLFDLGLLAIEPKSLVVDVHEDLAVHASYGALKGAPLQVKLPKSTVEWLAIHWEEHRKPGTL